MQTRRIAILGSTGSIGRQALEVIDTLNAGGGRFEILALAGHRNVALLDEQVRRYRPKLVGITDAAIDLRLPAVEVIRGPEALGAIAGHPEVDIVVHAVVGAAGLAASFAACRAGKVLALANKESLVVGGALLVEEGRRGGATILPVDSEHSAVFQALQCGRREEIERVLLTASGGPFRTWSLEQMRSATVDDALAHPTWAMGDRITVGSATLFNKALEIIEAVHLFDLSPDRIDVVVHPESVVHSMVEFVDGSVMAQLSPPDMKTPIGYALTWPHRGRPGGRRMDWSQSHRLHFEPPDPGRFPALRLARAALELGGSAPVTLNAAHEVAVERFLARRLSFCRISEVVEVALQQAAHNPVTSLEDLLAADGLARRVASEIADARP
jgi:1-deoxy-D-xylulose-5-phosphate reductoisomerase